MDKVYETPVAVELGDFHRETGEASGPNEEQVFPFNDRSPEPS